MAVHLRLLRTGAKKQPYYRIVATDSRRSRDGRFLEIVGTYNPIAKPAEVKVFEDKLTTWLNQGAQPTDTVRSLLTQIGFIEKYSKAKRGEDVTEMALKTTINERPKKTRKMRKAAVAKAETEEASEAPDQTEETKEAEQSDETPTEQ
ncbi:MAG: 30S ribosomal protein S16 [Candidatus Zixiibacteriota bacterium]|nr:MAG: 30S ribosomal protein S16 [candidate division Zixibacteria bacterium]